MPSVKFLKIHPKTWESHLALRFELLGCEAMGEIKSDHSFELSTNAISSVACNKMIIYFPFSNIQYVLWRRQLVTEQHKVHAPLGGSATTMGLVEVINYQCS